MTDDSDFKKIVRERMARTGESYTTARAHLLRKAAQDGRSARQGDAASEAHPHDTTAFSMGDGTTVQGELDRMQAAVSASMLEGEALLGTDAVHVSLGGFEALVPYERIRDVSTVPDTGPGSNLGVHGIRGRWIVNASYTGLVQVEIDPPIRADFRVRDVVERVRAEHGPAPEVPRLLRPLLRNRRPKVRVLVISVIDRDAFVSALRQRRAAVKR